MSVSRVYSAALGRLKLLVDRRYASRHPGPFARLVIAVLAPFVRLMPANDRWSLGVHGPHWIGSVCDLPEHPAATRRRIFLFCAYRGQFTIDLTFAALLLWRGHSVTFAYLPKLRSPIKVPLADHTSAAAYLKAALAGLSAISGGRLTVVDLSAYGDGDGPIDRSFLERQAHSDAVMRLQRESIAPDRAEDAEVLEHYRQTGARAQQMAYRFLSTQRDRFDLAVVGNGTTFESANVCNVLKRIGIPLNTYEKFAFRNVRVVNHGDDFRSFFDLDLVWKLRSQLGYVGAYREFAVRKARELVDARRRSSTDTWAWSLQRSPSQSTREALAAAGLDPQRPFVLVCTNVPYDAGYDKFCRIFPSMREWLVHTVRLLIERTNLQVVVRAHPGEAAHYGGTERSEENLAVAGFGSSERLTIIPGGEPINTYGLMEACKFGIVFSSTTGLEMAMMGKPVVVGADVYYGRRGFTTDVDDRNNYDLRVIELSDASDGLALTTEQSEDAALFHFMLHYVMQWPYPWHKGGDAASAPPDRLIRCGMIDKFVPMIDAIATPPDEFRARVDEFMSVRSCRHLPRPDVGNGGVMVAAAMSSSSTLREQKIPEGI